MKSNMVFRVVVMLNLVSVSIIRWAGLHIRHCSFCHLCLKKLSAGVFALYIKRIVLLSHLVLDTVNAKLITCRTFYFRISVYMLITAARKSTWPQRVLFSSGTCQRSFDITELDRLSE